MRQVRTCRAHAVRLIRLHDACARRAQSSLRRLRKLVLRARLCAPYRRSMSLIVDLQQRKSAEHVRRVGRRSGGEIRSVKLGKTRNAEEPETALQFVLQKL